MPLVFVEEPPDTMRDILEQTAFLIGRAESSYLDHSSHFSLPEAKRNL